MLVVGECLREKVVELAAKATRAAASLQRRPPMKTNTSSATTLLVALYHANESAMN